MASAPVAGFDHPKKPLLLPSLVPFVRELVLEFVQVLVVPFCSHRRHLAVLLEWLALLLLLVTPGHKLVISKIIPWSVISKDIRQPERRAAALTYFSTFSLIRQYFFIKRKPEWIRAVFSFNFSDRTLKRNKCGFL